MPATGAGTRSASAWPCTSCSSSRCCSPSADGVLGDVYFRRDVLVQRRRVAVAAEGLLDQHPGLPLGRGHRARVGAGRGHRPPAAAPGLRADPSRGHRLLRPVPGPSRGAGDPHHQLRLPAGPASAAGEASARCSTPSWRSPSCTAPMWPRCTGRGSSRSTASQTAAARSLGLTYGQTMRHVVVPQAVRRVVPPLLNDFIGLQKDTALIFSIGILEVLSRARFINNTPGDVHRLHDGGDALRPHHHPDDPLRRAAAAAGPGRACEPADPSMAFLEVDGVHKRFGSNEVLRGVDLDVDTHQVVCLIGASGSGKSTLLRCINALEDIDRRRDPPRRRAGERAGHRRQRLAQGRRHRVPELQPVPAHDRAAQRDPGPDEGARPRRR